MIGRSNWPIKPRIGLVLLVALAVLLQACGSSGSEYLSVGDQAPDFTLSSVSGGEVTLADYAGEQPVLLYFSMADG